MLIRRLNSILTLAGRNGPLVLFVGVIVGLIVPSLAAIMRPLMGFGVFVFILGVFLKVEPAALLDQPRHSLRLILALLWTGLGVPLVMVVFARFFANQPDLMQGMLLCAFAPPVGSAAAIAAMLSLDASLALILSITATLLSPLYLPVFASWFVGRQLEIDPIQMGVHLIVIVGGAALAAAAMRRFASAFVSKNPNAMTGLAVGGLIIVALGAMRGASDFFIEQPGLALTYFCLAFAINAGLCLLGAALFSSCGRYEALTVGLVSGNRNVTLAWAVSSASLSGHLGSEIFFAMSVFPIFLLPIVWKALLRFSPAMEEASVIQAQAPTRPTAVCLAVEEIKAWNKHGSPPSPSLGSTSVLIKNVVIPKIRWK